MTDVPEPEPIFVLRAQDPIAPTVLHLYAIHATMIHAPQDVIDHARAAAQRMRTWRDLNGNAPHLNDLGTARWSKPGILP